MLIQRLPRFLKVHPTQPGAAQLLQAASRTSAGRLLGCTAILWLLAFFYCKHRFWRDPHSAFFDSSTVYDLRYSRLRQMEAVKYVNDANLNRNLRPHLPSPNPVICAAFVTVRREPIQYLNESIGSLLSGLTSEERNALSIRLLFANTDPSIHPHWNETWLHLSDHWGSYDISRQELDHLRKLEEDQNFYEKGVLYVIAPTLASIPNLSLT